jgi:hypothetical protein
MIQVSLLFEYGLAGHRLGLSVLSLDRCCDIGFYFDRIGVLFVCHSFELFVLNTSQGLEGVLLRLCIFVE